MSPLTPLAPSVSQTPPPIPLHPMDEYEAQLKTKYGEKKYGFYIDIESKAAISIIDIDGKKSIVRIHLHNTDQASVSSTLEKFDKNTCENMVRIARNIGLGKTTLASGKVVSAVKFEINKDKKQMKTQKIYNDHSTGELRDSRHYSEKAKDSTIIDTRARYNNAASQLNDLGTHFFKSQQQPLPALAPRLPNRAASAPAPVPVEPPSQKPAAKPVELPADNSPNRHAGQVADMIDTNEKIGNSGYNDQDLKNALYAYYAKPDVNIKIKVGNKEASVKDIFTAAIKRTLVNPTEAQKAATKVIKTIFYMEGLEY